MGDEVEVKGEKLKVTGVDADTLEVTLQDGKRYGVQSVQNGEVLWVEKAEQVSDPLGVMQREEAANEANSTPIDSVAEKNKQPAKRKTGEQKAVGEEQKAEDEKQQAFRAARKKHAGVVEALKARGWVDPMLQGVTRFSREETPAGSERRKRDRIAAIDAALKQAGYDFVDVVWDEKPLQRTQREDIRFSLAQENELVYDSAGNPIAVKPEVLREIEEDMRNIRENAIASGQMEVDAKGSVTKLYAPNGKESKLNEDQWLAARTKRFKRWFGDWEAGSHRAFLNRNPVAKVDLSIAPIGGHKELREWATGLFESQGGKAKNSIIGDVALDGRSVRDSIAHGGANPYKRAAFAVIKDVIEKGQLIHTIKHGGRIDHFIAAPVMIGKNENVVVALVRKNSDTQRMYLHSVGLKESLLTNRVSGNSENHSGSNLLGDVSSILRSVFSVNPDSVSKVVACCLIEADTEIWNSFEELEPVAS